MQYRETCRHWEFVYMKGMYNENYIEEMVALLSILSQINLIKERFSLDNESDN